MTKAELSRDRVEGEVEGATIADEEEGNLHLKVD